MRRQRIGCAAVLLLLLITAGMAGAQQAPSAPAPPQKQKETAPAEQARPEQKAEEDRPFKPGPEGERIINLQSPYGVGGGILQVIFTHRFSEGVNHSDFHSFYSLDSQATVNVGVAYGFADWLEVGLDRSTQLDDWELALKWIPFRQSPRIPLTAALRVGGDWRSERDLSNRGSLFAQAILGRKIGERVQVTLAPSYVSRSPDPFSLNGTIRDVFNVPVAVAVGLSKTVNLHGEYIFRNRDVASSGRGIWAVAIEKTVLGHRFSVVASNALGHTVDQLLATNSPSGYPANDVHIGFNLIRQWRLK